MTGVQTCALPILELLDNNGDLEEFAVLEYIDFESRIFAVMAPLVEFQAYLDKDSSLNSDFDFKDLNIEVLEAKDDDFIALEGELFIKRLMAHIDEVYIKLEMEGK